MRQPNRKLALEIQTLLDEPLYQWRSPNYGTKILNAVLDAVADALHRGEKVYIRGFGIFKVEERRPVPTPSNIVTNDRHGRPSVRAQGLRYYKPRLQVIFQPSMAFMAMINMPDSGATPNHKERRAQLRWGSREGR